MDNNLGVVARNDSFRDQAINLDLTRFAVFTSQPLKTGMATGAFISSRLREAISSKGRRATAPLSSGYIDDADAVVYRNNPRSSASSIEAVKLFGEMQNFDKLAYERARAHRAEIKRAFPQEDFPSPKDIGSYISASFYGLGRSDPTVPSIQEFSQNSRFSRTEENNTLEYNTKVLNEHVDKFRANDYRILSHDYSSTDRYGYLPITKVFSTANGKLNLDNHICTRRTQVNGESHFIVKYGENGALPGTGKVQFAYAKLTNRLSLYPSENRLMVENLSVSYNLDPRNIRSMYLRDVDLVFHDYGNICVTVLVNTKNLAKYFDDNGFTGQYSHVYLEELIKAKALFGVWVSKAGTGATVIDVVNDRKYDLINADSENALNMWHVAHIDNAKSHLCKISSLASVSAFSGKELVSKIQSSFGAVKYGTVIKAIHDNEVDGRLDSWLESPLLARLYDTHDDGLFKEMQRELGKLHMPNVTIDGKKVPMLVASHDFLDIERENELALLFSTYFLMMEHRKRKEEKTKRDQAVVASCEEGVTKNETKSVVKAFAYSHFPIALNQVFVEGMMRVSEKGKAYSGRPFSEYRDDFLAFRPELASRVEITRLATGRTHVWLKGNSFNNNYNEEYLVWGEQGKVRWEKCQSSYDLGEGPNVRYLLNPALMTMVNPYRNKDTLKLTGKEDLLGYFGDGFLDKKNWF